MAVNETPPRTAPPDPPAAPDVDARGHVWSMMRDLVLEYGERRREVSEALGMSFVRTKALRRLAAGPLTMRDLATALGTDKAYITLTVDGLEERGLVERTTHPEDRRYKLVTLTDAGRTAAIQADTILRRPPDALSALSPDELADLERLLETLVTAAKSGGTPPEAGG
ncbi:MAG: MarR family transcriptional regulator [Streptomycetaceae bacterium]|nr:MarR family transcriptional regulator [Streptomycetaceae bacterium]